MLLSAVLSTVLLAPCCLAIFNDCPPYPFRNTSLSLKERVQDLVSRISLSDKILQMARGGASDNGPAPAIEYLCINPYQWGTECLSGDTDAGPATSFPEALGLTATFNYDLLYSVASATATEVRAKNNNATAHGSYAFHTGLSCWSPVINILRDPRWGRNQETYGEDPWLSGYMATAFVTGLQGDNPMYVKANAGCKHFDVHGGPENIPVSRFSFNAVVSMNDWRMTFLPQFKACVEAGAWSLMCSFNSINGVPACANNELLTNILRDEWNFPGYVVSDQGAIVAIVWGHQYAVNNTEAAAFAVNAGVCLEDADNEDDAFATGIPQALQLGLIQPSTIDDAVSRLFMVRMKLGEFDPPEMNPYTTINVSVVQSDEHRALALQAALESIVLLKNTPLTGLPIENEVDTACVVGPFIDNPYSVFGDYSPTVMLEYVVTPLQGIKTLTNIGKSVLNSADGCSDSKCSTYDSASVKAACNGVDLVIACLGTGSIVESEGNDRADINLPGSQLQLLQDAASVSKGPVVLVLYNAGPLDVSWAKNSDQVVSILESFFPAQSAGTALASVLTGQYNPGGRLPNTWPASLDQVPDITNYTMVGRTYRYFQGEPLYPFGYGLSYSSFYYSSLTIAPTTVPRGSSTTVSFTVANKGPNNGDEVSQVYISWPPGTVGTPQLQLVAVNRTALTNGNYKGLSFTITSDQMSIYTTEWVVPTGTYTVYVGGQQPNQLTRASSNVLEGTFTVQ